MSKINIFILGVLQTFVKQSADANLSFDEFFPWKLARLLTVTEQRHTPMYHAIKYLL